MEHFFLPPEGPIQKPLDELLFPVLGVELHAGKHMITKVVNKSACSWLNKEPGEIIQHLTGNALACVHARLAEGCGGATPCQTCALLLSVAETVKSGKPLAGALAMLCQAENGSSRFRMLKLSTMRSGGLVMLRLDEA
jgi:hypothetical protein